MQRIVLDRLAPLDKDRRHVVVEELLVLIVADDYQRVELRVGQSVVRDSGAVKPVLGNGTIQIERPAPPPGPPATQGSR